jgi:hypothetical protein
MSNGQQGQQSTLQNVYSYSFTANNLFQISLVKDMDPNRPWYKRQFFCFLTLAPGEQAQGGGRTYNFSNKINMKQDVHNVMALAHALRAVARGQKALIGNFSLFTDSSKSTHGQGGAVKQVFVNEYIKQPQNQQGQQGAGERFVSLGFRFGQNKPIGLMFSIPDALSCADILEYIGKMGLKLDASGASVSFAAKPPQGQPNVNPPAQNYQTGGGGYGPPQGHPNVNTAENVLNNFQDGLSNASGPGPASPPSVGDFGNNDIPF